MGSWFADFWSRLVFGTFLFEVKQNFLMPQDNFLGVNFQSVELQKILFCFYSFNSFYSFLLLIILIDNKIANK